MGEPRNYPPPPIYAALATLEGAGAAALVNEVFPSVVWLLGDASGDVDQLALVARSLAAPDSPRITAWGCYLVGRVRRPYFVVIERRVAGDEGALCEALARACAELEHHLPAAEAVAPPARGGGTSGGAAPAEAVVYPPTATRDQGAD